MDIGDHIEEIIEYNRMVANMNWGDNFERIAREYMRVYEPEVFKQEEPKWAKEGRGVEQD